MYTIVYAKEVSYEVRQCARFTRPIRRNLARVARGARDGRNQQRRPIAILATVNESNLEESLAAFRQARAIEAVSHIQRRSVAAGTDAISAEDIEAEIAATRQARRR